jgi:hypothetical protein
MTWWGRALCVVVGHRYTEEWRIDADGVKCWMCRRCRHKRYNPPQDVNGELFGGGSAGG